MQTISSRDAQLRFGSFSREARKDAVIVTSHGHPIFVTIPVKISGDVAEIIQKLSPATPLDTAARLEQFFARLALKNPEDDGMTDAERSAFIKSPD